MNDVARVTVLVDNCVQGLDLLAEHGLAFWVEIRGRGLLFDTGQGMVLSHNASKLGVPLEQVGAVVLSHGHYDHTGGLGQMLQVAPQAEVYAHSAALRPRYARKDDGSSREVSMPPVAREAIGNRGDTVIWTDRPTEIHEGLFATGEIQRRTDYEDTGGPFFLDRQGQRPDLLLDDQALFFESRPGTIVLLGCAHAGVINTLQCVREQTGGRPIHAVLGGMHLVTASPSRMDGTIEGLRQLAVERLGPSHCTGPRASAELWSAFAGRCFPCTVGTKMEFEMP